MHPHSVGSNFFQSLCSQEAQGFGIWLLCTIRRDHTHMRRNGYNKQMVLRSTYVVHYLNNQPTYASLSVS